MAAADVGMSGDVYPSSPYMVQPQPAQHISALPQQPAQQMPQPQQPQAQQPYYGHPAFNADPHQQGYSGQFSASQNSGGGYSGQMSGQYSGGGQQAYSGGQMSMPSLLMSSSEREAVAPVKPIDRSRRQNESGKTIVTTPWYPEGKVKDEIRLADEVNQLGKLLQLTSGEVQVRHRCRSSLQGIVREIWPNVTVKVYGSFGYGLSLPGSALDVVCEGCSELEANMEQFVQRVMGIGFKVEAQYVSGNEGFALIRAGDVTAYFALVEQPSRARQSVTLMRRLLEKFPYAAPVFAVTRLLLQQSRLNDANSGGLSSYALLVMIFDCCFNKEPKDAGQLLVGFLEQFGKPDQVVFGAARYPERKPTKDKALYVEDPLDASNNLAAGCQKMVQIKNVFTTSSMTLQKWLNAKWSGYRGRTPLSSILAYGDLWDRAALKQQQK